MTLEEKYRALRHTLQFYANENNYNMGKGSTSAHTDRGQRAREILAITDGQETSEQKI